MFIVNGIGVPRNIYQNPEFSDYDVLTYAAMQRMMVVSEEPQNDPFVCELRSLCHAVYGTFDVPLDFSRSVGKSISDLISKGAVVGTQEGKGIYEMVPIEMEDEYFALVSYSDIKRIFESDFKHKLALFRHWCWLAGSFYKPDSNSSLRIGNHTIDYFSENEDISETTIIRYNKELEKAKVAHIVRANNIYKTNDEFTRSPNIYGRYKDKVAIDEYCDNKRGRKKNISDTMNGNRSVSMRYNHFKNHPDAYTRQELIKLYHQCQSYNEHIEDPSRQKDLSIFGEMALDNLP